MTMGELINMSKELYGLKSVRLTDEGNFVCAIPKQIIRDGESGYTGLPELVMAKEFANIPVTLEKDYTNYRMEDVPVKFRGVFNYDLNKHLIENLLDFRSLINNEEWFFSQDIEVQEAIKASKYYMVEDGKSVMKQKALLVNDSMTNGDIVDHIKSYTTDLVFYADPQIGYRLEPKARYQSTGVFYRVDSEEEAKALGVEKGAYIKTPWLKFVNQYNSAFNKIYLNPIREKYPNISNSDFKDLPEVAEANENRLVNNPNYLVVTLMNRIIANVRDEIELESGGTIPTYLNKMQLKAGHFEKYFKHERDSDVHFEPSYAIMKLSIPKREGNEGLDYRKQYEGIKTFKPEVTIKTSKSDNRVPNLHPEDKTYSKRFKEEMLNFPFKQTYVTSNSSGFGQQLKLSAINEIIRNISIPMYHKLEEGDYLKDNLKEFLVNDLKMELEELQVSIDSLNETGGQFSGIVTPPIAPPAAPPTAPIGGVGLPPVAPPMPGGQPQEF